VPMCTFSSVVEFRRCLSLGDASFAAVC